MCIFMNHLPCTLELDSDEGELPYYIPPFTLDWFKYIFTVKYIGFSRSPFPIPSLCSNIDLHIAEHYVRRDKLDLPYLVYILFLLPLLHVDFQYHYTSRALPTFNTLMAKDMRSWKLLCTTEIWNISANTPSGQPMFCGRLEHTLPLPRFLDYMCHTIAVTIQR
jgi:hypothetical protein